MQVISASLHK